MLPLVAGGGGMRRADAAAALPFIDTSLIALHEPGGFVTATVAGLDGGYNRIFIRPPVAIR
jgi:hypothetical protein